MPDFPSFRFSTAPMLDWTDRHCRRFWRIMTKRSLLYTEMVTSGAIIYGKNDYLAYDEAEHPVAVQLAGCDPKDLAVCAKRAEEKGYDEINLNCGCPSDRVQNGGFGAALMLRPDLVADIVKAMTDAVSVPVTVKCRIGIDNEDSPDFLRNFVRKVSAAGCRRFIIHARKAWLEGLSPSENRSVPPLIYERVHMIKREFPDLMVVINGGLSDLGTCLEELRELDGVMVGRAAWENPAMLLEVDERIFGAERNTMSRADVVREYLGYIEKELSLGVKLTALVKPMLGIFHSCPGGKLFSKAVSEEAWKKGAGAEVVEKALMEQKKAEEAFLEYRSRLPQGD